MAKIRRLSLHIANQIAAGEVIERPSSAVKELVENSLDAGARRVQVFVSEGGRTLRVVDDGDGMTAEDALMAFERFATSKIQSAEDLFHLTSNGFRGEALASIASIAKVTLTTRARGEQTGTQVVIHGGSEPEVSPAGCPEGTQILVEELFYNTPARLKFMRSANTEIGHVVETVTALALANPDTQMVLTSNGREVFNTSGATALSDTAAYVLGLDIGQAMLPVEGESPHGVLKGLVSPPELIRSGRDKQWFFLNGRPVRHPTLARAVEEAFLGHIPSGRHPLYILSLTVDPERVDVNVHPTKKEVRLADAQSFFFLIREAVSRALRRNPIATAEPQPFAPPSFGATMPAPPASAAADPRIPPLAPAPSGTPTFGPPAFGGFGSVLKPAEPRSSEHGPGATEAAMDAYRPLMPARPTPYQQHLPDLVAQSREVDFPWDSLRIIGQLHNTYIVLEHPDGLYLLDQHNSHERYLYEQLLPAEPISQELLLPVPLTLSHAEQAVLEENLGKLEALGFRLEPFGEATWAVRAVPSILPVSEAEEVIRDMLGRGCESRFVSPKNKDDAWRVSIACHSATRAGDRLNEEQMQRILSLWRKCEQPFTCPHGRPTGFLMPMNELNRRCLRG
ncbi:DNA mismatch repair protein MutL [compost metagenome]